MSSLAEMAKILVYIAILGSSLVLGVDGAYTMWKKGSLVSVKLNSSRPSILQQRSNNWGSRNGDDRFQGWKSEDSGSAFRKGEGGFHPKPKLGMPGNMFGEFVPQTNTKPVPSWLKRRLTASPPGIGSQIPSKDQWRSSRPKGSLYKPDLIDLSKPKTEYFGSKLPFFEPLRLPKYKKRPTPPPQSPQQCIPDPSNNYYCGNLNVSDGTLKEATASLNNTKRFGPRANFDISDRPGLMSMKNSSKKRRYRLIGYR